MFKCEIKGICEYYNTEYIKNHDKIDQDVLIKSIFNNEIYKSEKFFKYLKKFIHKQIPFFENTKNDYISLKMLIPMNI